MGLLSRNICQYKLREERRKVERIIEALPKPTLKKKDDGPKETASETDKP